MPHDSLQTAKLRAKNLDIIQLTEETVDNVLGKARTHVLLEIYAPWCPHCQHFEPQFNELVKRMRKSDRLSGDDKFSPCPTLPPLHPLSCHVWLLWEWASVTLLLRGHVTLLLSAWPCF